MADITPVVNAIVALIDRKIDLAFQARIPPAGGVNTGTAQQTKLMQDAVNLAVGNLTQAVKTYQTAPPPAQGNQNSSPANP